MKDLPIGIFDSGLGGLTVVREVLRVLPHEHIIYLGDTARCPYGPRPREQVREFVLQIASLLAERDVKLLVVACNTGTAAGLEAAQRAFKVPVIGVVEPGARAAVRATVNRRIGVIGTEGTIDSDAYSRAIRMLDAGVTAYSTATPRFVELAEQGLRMGPGTLEEWLAECSEVFVRPSFYRIARAYLEPLKRVGIDTLVLGCTHFPLLATAIQQVVGGGVRLISSAEETARDIAETLAMRDVLASREEAARLEFITTGDAAEFARLGSRVLRRKIAVADIEALPLESLDRPMESLPSLGLPDEGMTLP